MIRHLILLAAAGCSIASGTPPGPIEDRDPAASETPEPLPEVSPCAPVRPFECSGLALDAVEAHLETDPATTKRPPKPGPPSVKR